MAKAHSLYKEVREIVQALSAVKKPNAAVLRIAIEEQRRVYDELNEATASIKIKILTLTGAGLALLTFLYANPSNLKNPLFIPPQIYGKIFYIVGLILTLGSLGMLLY